MRKLRWWLIFPGLILAFIFGFIFWASTPLGPMPEALTAINSDENVQFIDDGWMVFKPERETPLTGLVLYPGGRVDWRSYAPLAREIAAQGYLVVITPMPLNLAVIAPGKADEVMQAYPNIERWVVGGHSLGGAMAANFAYQNPEKITGLVLWAAYPADNNDLSKSNLPVVSIFANQDGLADPQKITASRVLLPPNTIWVEVKGGNHAQFGWYGVQNGDGQASISREEQQNLIVSATVDLLNRVERR
jgi:hypothetical protein